MPLSAADQGLLDAARYGTGKLLAVWLKRGANPAVASPLDDASWTNGTAGFGVWHWLVDHRHDALLAELRDRPDTPFPLTLQDAHGNTAAHLAAERHPEVWSRLWTPDVAQCLNQYGDTALDVLRHHHPEYLPTLDAPSPDVPVVAEPGSQDVVPPAPAGAFPDAWSAPPTPDPLLPGEAGISHEAWQRRLWAPNLSQIAPAPALPDNMVTEEPEAAPVPDSPALTLPTVEWATFALDDQGNPVTPQDETTPRPIDGPDPDAAIPFESPREGERVLDPIPVNEADAWVVDLEALLRPTSLLHAAGHGRPARAPTPPRPLERPIVPPSEAPLLSGPRSPLTVPDLRLLDNPTGESIMPLHPLDEHPEEAVGHAFIADPGAWTAFQIQERNDGVTVPVSLEEFQLPRTLTPPAHGEPVWSVSTAPLPVLHDDVTAPPGTREANPTAPPAWAVVPMGPGPDDLAAAVAAQMAQLGQHEMASPNWALLPMTGIPVPDRASEAGWDEAPVALDPVNAPAWKLVDA